MNCVFERRAFVKDTQRTAAGIVKERNRNILDKIRIPQGGEYD